MAGERSSKTIRTVTWIQHVNPSYTSNMSILTVSRFLFLISLRIHVTRITINNSSAKEPMIAYRAIIPGATTVELPFSAALSICLDFRIFASTKALIKPLVQVCESETTHPTVQGTLTFQIQYEQPRNTGVSCISCGYTWGQYLTVQVGFLEATSRIHLSTPIDCDTNYYNQIRKSIFNRSTCFGYS